MANEDQVALLRSGSAAWNAWRAEIRDISPDLRAADLSCLDLHEANLSGADLRSADLSRAYLGAVDLSEADLSGAVFMQVHLTHTDLSRANLSGACLNSAHLDGANLRGVDLRRADLREVDLSGKDLVGVNLSGADLRCSNLVGAILDKSTLTNAKLWEARRRGWSIKEATCERCFWDRAGKVPTQYQPGDFERVFGPIVLDYPDGIPTEDLAILPLVIEQLQNEHPQSVLRIFSVKDEGGLATISITVDDIANRSFEVLREEAQILRSKLERFQQLLQQETSHRQELESQMKLMKGYVMPTILRALRSTTSVSIGTMSGGHVGDIAHSHDFQAGSTTIYQGDQLDEMRKLIEAVQERQHDIQASTTPEEVEELKEAVASIRTQLEASEPEMSTLQKAVGVISRVTERTATSDLAELAKKAAASLVTGIG